MMADPLMAASTKSLSAMRPRVQRGPACSSAAAVVHSSFVTRREHEGSLSGLLLLQCCLRGGEYGYVNRHSVPI
jgi:hypothetical protein